MEIDRINFKVNQSEKWLVIIIIISELIKKIDSPRIETGNL